MESVLKERSRDRGRSFRAEDEAALAVQRYVVHLVANDVARLADGLRKDTAILDDRRHDSRVAVSKRASLDHRLERVKGGRFFGEQVPHPARGLITRHGTTHDRPIE